MIANKDFSILDKDENDLELRIEGATAFASAFSITFFPRESLLYVEAYQLPIDGNGKPIQYGFERWDPADGEKTENGRLPGRKQ